MPLNISGFQILAHLFNFSILAGGLYLLLYKPVKNFMERRQAHYIAMAREAEEKLRQAEESKRKYEQMIEDADEMIRIMTAKAEKDAQAAAREQVAAAKARASRIYSDARSSAQREREKILDGAHEELREMALTATERLLLESQGDPYEQFLKLAERRGSHE